MADIDGTEVRGQARPDLMVRVSGRDETPQQQVRRANERRVFHHVRRGEALSRVSLVRATGLSAQSVGDIIRVLIEQGLIEETGAEPQPGLGRYPIGVRIRPRGALAFGCNIERDRLDGAWIDLTGAVVTSKSGPYKPGEEPRTTIGRIEALYERLTSRLTDADGPRLAVVGLAMPGPIDPQSQRLVNPPNFAQWEGVDPRAEHGEERRQEGEGGQDGQTPRGGQVGRAWRPAGQRGQGGRIGGDQRNRRRGHHEHRDGRNLDQPERHAEGCEQGQQAEVAPDHEAAPGMAAPGGRSRISTRAPSGPARSLARATVDRAAGEQR